MDGYPDAVIIHLVDGTYELFRHFYAMPPAKNRDGEEVAAVRGVMYSIRALVQEGATHIAVATDHVIESFRNDLWPGYKTGEGMEPALLAQFHPLEEALAAMERWSADSLPVVSDLVTCQVAGMLDRNAVLAAYNKALLEAEAENRGR